MVVAGCGAEGILGPPAHEGRAGLHVTGALDGRQVAVSDGGPRLFEGNCQPAAGAGEDVCFISRDLDGRLFVLLLRNPRALVAGERLTVETPDCTHCDDVTGVAVVDVRIGDQSPVRATGGSLTLTAVEPAARYAGRVRLEFPSGALTADFDVIPRPD